MDDLFAAYPIFGRKHGVDTPIPELSVRQIAEQTLTDRGLKATATIDADESTYRVTYLLESDGRTLQRTTRFSSDADPSLVAALVRKAAKRLERDIAQGPQAVESPHRFWNH